MKRDIRFCLIVKEPDYYNKEKRVFYTVQKKGWFGWKTFYESYEGDWMVSYGFSYFYKAERGFGFKSIEEAILFLRFEYGKNKGECMLRIIKWMIALVRLNKNLVCEVSSTMGVYDFHDYPDDVDGQPWHFVLLKCKRCGKRFYI